MFHPIEGSGFPDEFDGEFDTFHMWWCFTIFEFETNFFVTCNSDDTTACFPSGDSLIGLMFYFQLVARHQSNVITFRWKHEISESFVWDRFVPPHSDRVLSLGFLELAIIFCLQFNQWFKHVFILLRVSVSQKHRLLALFHCFFFLKVLQIAIRFFFPHFFQLINLFRFYLSALRKFYGIRCT